MIENVIIIGGGPAGLSAAIYLARANLKPLVFAGSPSGGQLMLTSEVENYPGYESILGAELITKMRNQAMKLGTRIVDDNVLKVEFSKKPFAMHLSKLSHDQNFSGTKLPSISHEAVGSSKFGHSNNVLNAKSIIVATGAKALWLGVPGEERLRGKGVSACATCDGFFFRNKTVAVIGGGDTALEEALTLTKFAEKVYLIHRRDSFKASKIMRNRVLKHPKIEIIWNVQVEEILGENHVEAIKLQVNSPEILSRLNSSLALVEQKVAQKFGSLTHKNQVILPVKGIFVAIGHKPDTNLFKDQVELDEKGYILTSVRKAVNNSQFLINLISNQVPNPNQPIEKLDIGNYLGQLDQLEIRNFNYNYQTMTSIEGVFAAGDCVDSVYRQASTAMGMGVAASLEVERWLNQLK
ncbi:hypothetical protein AUK04_02380 [Candidatus Roizmanbacteria bacterium CG2_30_33_16]|uniref:Thioredoxin-disulfide reductase n=4 Tax=Candidatus Roizmaniibacteriota TaxID=1752723 RepID=A0A2M7E3F1_9BACT|nr:FAD-dependent oxidoreductase [Candidatus Roizmanbacteria bacterium]OIP84452.1 MAG: hypothetical protein AUK04_02380 [Candidatus Roizmanbacteria bacterium CG2_30_33_16]PIV62250.1 MAG: thioredoxin-disulfide reductase [Candidatus Roizmanbacteria bacterium CG01_land_8_20_14_3_00_33_9]PIX71007.1 MAG: thioredoxin-disulfide reductase [Candidatus Roizmanbacteria bacterium CG_4_10_14_3_um_filter_33_21]PJB88176.1 MAG: thioredoxin-disulfide reductase [Candidatus Roizmanbacteria bacterium CG_4_9_14_0_8_